MKTRQEYEKYLNEVGESLGSQEFIIKGKMRCGAWGTMLRKYDPTAFNVGFHEWKYEA